MLGRKDYSQEEFDQAKLTIDRQVKAYRKLAKSIDGERSALEAFEPLFFKNLTLALDRFFVHRIRAVAGKDGNPLNEVELIADSLITGDGTLRPSTVIKYEPERSVLKLEPGERIALSADEFERLAKAFFAELETKFVN